MKKWLLLFLVFIMMIASQCALAANLPDVAKFSNGAATLSGTDTGSNSKRWTYQGEKEMVEIFKEYVNLLEKSPELKRIEKIVPKDSPIIEMYCYDYVGRESIVNNKITISSIGWSGYPDVYVRCTKNEGKYFITLYSSAGFSLVDSGERTSVKTKVTAKPTTKPTVKPTVKPTKKPTAKPAVKITAKPTAKPAVKITTKPTAKPTAKPIVKVSCTKCGGDGRVNKDCSSCTSGTIRCGSCSGDGKKDCISCSGKGYDRCSGCGGDGENRCSSCFGSGKRNGKRCSSCSGSGDKRCSSCSGKGKKTCSACRGSGDRKCSNCGGDGRKDCTVCSGRGTKSSVCSTCSGSGKVKK